MCLCCDANGVAVGFRIPSIGGKETPCSAAIGSRGGAIDMDVKNNIFTESSFSEITKRAMAFFEGTEFYSLPVQERFNGAGVYAIYYTGENELYSLLGQKRIDEQRIPIYVGKAVPSGWRQGRKKVSDAPHLFHRLNEHCRSITKADNLSIENFSCRFTILVDEITSLIGVLESELIGKYTPIWNSCIDGFGNHDPGAGRYEQARSEWDTLHPGRIWASKLNDNLNSVSDIKNKGISFLESVGGDIEDT